MIQLFHSWECTQRTLYSTKEILAHPCSFSPVAHFKGTWAKLNEKPKQRAGDMAQQKGACFKFSGSEDSSPELQTNSPQHNDVSRSRRGPGSLYQFQREMSGVERWRRYAALAAMVGGQHKGQGHELKAEEKNFLLTLSPEWPEIWLAHGTQNLQSQC